MWIVWGALIVVGVIFACGIAIGIYFDVRRWLEARHLPPSAAAATSEADTEFAHPEEPTVEPTA